MSKEETPAIGYLALGPPITSERGRFLTVSRGKE
jgi:hypothetical protein